MMGMGGAMGGGLLSSLSSGLFSLAGSALQGYLQGEEADEQRDWMEHMASTAYQRTMKDMRKAGLNPILAYSQGATGAGTGAAATSMPNIMEGMAAAAGDAAEKIERLKTSKRGREESVSREVLNDAKLSTEITAQHLNKQRSQEAYQHSRKLLSERNGQELMNKILDYNATDAQFRKRFYHGVPGSQTTPAGEFYRRFNEIMRSMTGRKD